MSGASHAETVDLIVLGASGYVGGELLRLAALHPGLRLAGAISRSAAGRPLPEVFPHLDAGVSALRFVGGPDEVEIRSARVALISALPHGESAALVAQVLASPDLSGRDLFVCDLSADFRHADPAVFEDLYGRPHGAPALAPRFRAGLPDLIEGVPDDHVAHPGCFTTAVVLGAVGLFEADLVRESFVASCVTGSTGSGGRPAAGTHHPDRHANLRAYSPLRHRHVPEMKTLLAEASARRPDPAFLPHSGPFARGIHATLAFELREPGTGAAAIDHLRRRWARHPFVRFVEGTPHLKDVVGSNRCALGAAAEGERIVVFSVIDNLLKGAAGGAIQWVNRRFALGETTGLTAGGIPWI